MRSILVSKALLVPAIVCLVSTFGPAAADNPQPPAAKAGDLPASTKEPSAGKIDFDSRIRPILEKYCLSCHGLEKQRGGLRLDTPEGIAEGGDNGPVLEPRKAADSELVKRIAGGVEPEKAMPPKGPALPAEDVAAIRAWIDQGANWKAEGAKEATAAHPHWSFNGIKKVKPPASADSRKPLHPIDAFISAKLESANAALKSKEPGTNRGRLSPSPEADRNTLIRRLYLDLLGLPPNPEEVRRFVDDRSTDAYEKLVDRVLASPHFGERWGRHWLDLARYADSDGYEKDLARPFAWRYRNWVIDAINRDMPFDQFTIEQLAGDLLPNATTEQKVATGFHRNTLINREGGIDPEEDRVKRCVDRVGTTATVWLGLTMQCCQCHSHKYDPLTQKEFYGLYAFFNGDEEVDIPAPTESETAAYREAKLVYDRKAAELKKRIADREPLLASALDEWETATKAAGKVYGWTVLEPASFLSAAGASMQRLADQSILVSGHVPAKDVYTVVLPLAAQRVTAMRLEALVDSALPEQGPGRADNGNFVLTGFTVKVGPRDEPAKAREVKFDLAEADYCQPGFEPQGAIDDKPTTGWAVADPASSARQSRTIVFTLKDELQVEANSVLTATLRQQYGGKHVLGRLRMSVAGVDRANIPGILPERVLAIFRIGKEQRTPEQRAALDRYYRTIDPEMSKLERELAELNRKAPVPPATRAQTLARKADPPKTRIHQRGDFLRPGAEVTAHTPAVLPPLKVETTLTSGSGPAASEPTRLDLARWIVDPANPLTARVAVNHVWKHLFGRGLVSTVDDFGTRGDEPTHPELLDWLARGFVEDGWSRKRLIKRIVTSATYRQASAPRPEDLELDPKNLLLSRQNRFRVEAETTRDLFLAASGLLNRTIGGPSIRPPLPGDVAALGYAGGHQWPETTGPEKYRRGMYIFFQRTVPYPMLMTFDSPDSNVTCSRRERSNTPLQALTLLNDPVFHECAAAFGKRMAEEWTGPAEARVKRAFETCLARLPSEYELERILKLVDSVESAVRKEEGRKEAETIAAAERKPEAEAIAGGSGSEGGSGAPARSESAVEPPKSEAKETSLHPVAALAVARVLFNLDEFLTRE